MEDRKPLVAGNGKQGMTLAGVQAAVDAAGKSYRERFACRPPTLRCRQASIPKAPGSTPWTSGARRGRAWSSRGGRREIRRSWAVTAHLAGKVGRL